MKEIKLSQHGKNKILNLVAIVDDEDYNLLNEQKWCVLKKRNRNVFYAYGRNGVQMHRLIMGLINPKIQCDHIDHNGLNNTKANLRTCSNSENQCNRKVLKRLNRTSKYKGVSWEKKSQKWKAQITSKGTLIYLGLFKEERQAAEAYNNSAKILHGDFACINAI